MRAPLDPRIQLGPEWEDLHGSGSFVVPAPPRAGIAEPPALVALASPRVALYVSSEKELKWRPALEALVARLAERFPAVTADEVRVHPLKTASTVPEQPLGCAAGEQGARARAHDPRIQRALEREAAVVVVSIESTLCLEPLPLETLPASWQQRYAQSFVDAQGRAAIDLAAVYLETSIGGRRQEALGWSEGVSLPMRYLEQAREGIDPDASGCARTCGRLMSSALGVSPDDWHRSLVGVSRAELLRRALEELLT